MVFERQSDSSSNALCSQPTEDTPLTKTQHLSSNPKTFANVFIAIVGAGVLGLPYTFKKTGWLMGTLMLFSVAFLTFHCMMLLVYTRRKVESLRKFAKISSFGDLGFAICGPIGRSSVDAMIVLTQACFCASYVLFVSNTLALVLNSDSRTIWGVVSPKAFYVWAGLPFQLGLNSIPTLTRLAPLSIFADVVDVGAMGIVMVKEAFIFMADRGALRAIGGLNVLLYGLGVAVYAFEGIGMVLPLESETRDRNKFGKILGTCMLAISVMYAGFGVLGYMAFGEETKDIVTTNLGAGVVSYMVQMGLCVNLFFTFPIMMNPVYEVVERRFWDGRYCLLGRWVLVLCVSLVALLVPNFADFLSLVGSSVCCVLGFVLPALFHWMVFKQELCWKDLVSDWLIVVLGLIISISGTCSSLSEIFGVKAQVSEPETKTRHLGLFAFVK